MLVWRLEAKVHLHW